MHGPLRLAHAEPRPDGPTGRSVAISALRRRLVMLSRSDSTVLLTGETGTGKGLVARSIHRHSSRRDRPFVHVDCAALSPTLIESELFGHERGAFSGALERRSGRFEQAADGTLFLDEIGELAPTLQAKLLRVLQDREYERVGGTRTLRMQARVIAATSRDLEAAVHAGTFRADLYYRLAVVELRIPPLRERLDDLPELVQTGIRRLAPRLGIAPPEVTSALCERLREHAWPGNVRELINCLERLLVEHPGQRLDAATLEGLGIPNTRPRLPTPMRAVPEASSAAGAPEVETIEAVLRETGGNVARAARRLGLPRTTLRHRIARLGLAHLIPHD